jgi:hypothetical protein
VWVGSKLTRSLCFTFSVDTLALVGGIVDMVRNGHLSIYELGLTLCSHTLEFPILIHVFAVSVVPKDLR